MARIRKATLLWPSKLKSWRRSLPELRRMTCKITPGGFPAENAPTLKLVVMRDEKAMKQCVLYVCRLVWGLGFM